MGLSLAAVAGLAAAEMNTFLVIFIIIFVIIFQLTIGTYAWVYLGQVNCDEGLSIGTLVVWTASLVIIITSSLMFDKMGTTGTFLFFACCSLASFAFFFLFLRETKGLSREEAQRLYSKADAVEAEHYRRDSIASSERLKISRQSGIQDHEIDEALSSVLTESKRGFKQP